MGKNCRHLGNCHPNHLGPISMDCSNRPSLLSNKKKTSRFRGTFALLRKSKGMPLKTVCWPFVGVESHRLATSGHLSKKGQFSKITSGYYWRLPRPCVWQKVSAPCVNLVLSLHPTKFFFAIFPVSVFRMLKYAKNLSSGKTPWKSWLGGMSWRWEWHDHRVGI